MNYLLNKISTLILLFLITQIKLFAIEKLPENIYTIQAINDNSLLLEEAYNQEERVVQHISSMTIVPNSNDYIYNFTQEWPAFGLNHQLSFTLPYASISKGKARGIGDIMLNYRYQIVTDDDGIAIAPRMSIILPSGKYAGLPNSGSWGLELNLPMSKRLSNYFVSHFNAGSRISFNNNEQTKASNTLTNFFGGIGVALLVTDYFNLMLESMTSFNASPENIKKYENETIIAPGARFAININSLQIVPGFEVPFKISSENSKPNPFLIIYLSFEHPY